MEKEFALDNVFDGKTGERHLKTSEIFGNSIRELLKKTDITRNEFAEAIGIGIPTMNSYMSGSNNPSLQTAVKIADFFGVPLDAMTGRINSEDFDNIAEQYKELFPSLLNASYQAYLKDGSRKKAIDYKVIAMYPYNLIEAVTNQTIFYLSDEQMGRVNYVLELLTPREKDILLEIYKEHKSRNTVASEWHLSEQRIRDIEHKALRKLRHPSRIKFLELSDEAFMDMREACSQKDETIRELRKQISEKDALIEQMVRESTCTSGAECTTNIVNNVYDYNLSWEGADGIGALSVRSYNCLTRAGIRTVRDLDIFAKEIAEWDAKKFRNLGNKSLYEIFSKMREWTGDEFYSDKSANNAIEQMQKKKSEAREQLRKASYYRERELWMK